MSSSSSTTDHGLDLNLNLYALLSPSSGSEPRLIFLDDNAIQRFSSHDSKSPTNDPAELGPHSTAKEIATSYRKKALLFHPDKNPDLRAKEHYSLLHRIYQFLSESSLRSEYDKLILARKQQVQLDSAVDSRIKAMKEKLEQMEREAHNRWKNKSAPPPPSIDLDKLRRENQEYLRSELQNLTSSQFSQSNDTLSDHDSIRTVLIKWGKHRPDFQSKTTNIPPILLAPNESFLKQMLSKFGEFEFFQFSDINKRASVVFLDPTSAQNAHKNLLSHTPWHIKWSGANDSNIKSSTDPNMNNNIHNDNNNYYPSGINNLEEYEIFTFNRMEHILSQSI
jgi:curved DNA-binding protein CbpA